VLLYLFYFVKSLAKLQRSHVTIWPVMYCMQRMILVTYAHWRLYSVGSLLLAFLRKFVSICLVLYWICMHSLMIKWLLFG